ncbi:shufflon-specific DNA recombinase [Ralstonia phage RS-PII-1]|uniref:Integrase n=1 Tax=Ralstonia phage RS-PII-1 TaxID=1932892 RepID=A0A1L7DQ84_9CAUD|nr:shufflon-specific DNA recombinase [Ralstonia phage RS-PII-1]APU00288.1 shufflon-specific DNA recombinase [Ralstonia phage RS-PII-1]
MGTIVRRTDSKGNVTFQAKVRRTGFPIISRSFPTRDQAETWAAEIEAGLQRGQSKKNLLGDTTPMSDLIARYLKEVTPLKKGADTERFHIRAIENSQIPRYTVATLTKDAVKEFRDERLKKVAASTVNRELNILHHMLEYARKEWGVSGGVNPVSDVERPKNPPARDRRLSPDEEVKLLAACDESRGGYLRDVVELALETAMRQSELIGLDWAQVDIERRTIRLLEGKTKNGHGRGVPLSKKAVEILKRRVSGPEDMKGPVFKDVTAAALKRAFIRAADRAGLENFHFHDLRHEATSRIFEKGTFNTMEVASITGHNDVRMLKRYTHLDASKLAEKLD